MAYITNTSFDTVLNRLEETEVVSERVIKAMWKHAYTVKDRIEGVESFEEKFEIFESSLDDFYDAVQIYEPIFSKSFRIWLLRSFCKLELELCHQN